MLSNAGKVNVLVEISEMSFIVRQKKYLKHRKKGLVLELPAEFRQVGS